MKDIGNKIVIVGVSGSGKSTFARKLEKKINKRAFFMDAIMWKPGWQYVGDEQTAKGIEEILLKNTEWIIEGYIVKNIRTRVLEEASTIIYLDYSQWVSVFRYLKRCWKHRKTPRLELEGSPEKFSFKFLKLVWTKGETISLNKFLEKVDQNKIIKLKSPKEALRLLGSL